MRQARASDEVRELIFSREMALHDEASRLYNAHEKGLQEGRHEGLQQGERQAQRAMGRKLLDRGMDLATVLDITGLRAEELD